MYIERVLFYRGGVTLHGAVRLGLALVAMFCKCLGMVYDIGKTPENILLSYLITVIYLYNLSYLITYYLIL